MKIKKPSYSKNFKIFSTNSYSSNKIGKEGCFERIVSRFGKDKSYTCIGSTGDNEHGARRQKIPFWPVLNHGDAASLVEVVNKRFL